MRPGARRPPQGSVLRVCALGWWACGGLGGCSPRRAGGRGGRTALVARGGVPEEDLHVGADGAEEGAVGAEAGAVCEVGVVARRLDELEGRALVEVHLRGRRRRRVLALYFCMCGKGGEKGRYVCMWEWSGKLRTAGKKFKKGRRRVGRKHRRGAFTCLSSEALTTRYGLMGRRSHESTFLPCPVISPRVEPALGEQMLKSSGHDKCHAGIKIRKRLTGVPCEDFAEALSPISDCYNKLAVR